MITVTTKRGTHEFKGAVYLTYMIEGYLLVYTMMNSVVMREYAYHIEEVISVKGNA